MGLLDDFGKDVLSGAFGGSEAGGSGSGKWVQLGIALLNRFGGLEGLMAKFQQAGLGGLVASWIGKGDNQSASAQEIERALGEENLQAVAADAGTDSHTAAEELSKVLPGLVDKLTPNGESMGEDALKQGIQALLGGKLGDLGKLFG